LIKHESEHAQSEEEQENYQQNLIEHEIGGAAFSRAFFNPRRTYESNHDQQLGT
jgi:hypothetical protein